MAGDERDIYLVLCHRMEVVCAEDGVLAVPKGSSEVLLISCKLYCLELAHFPILCP